MDAKELRIGNYVYADNLKSQILITTDVSEYITCLEKGGIDNYSVTRLNGIQLIEEWFLIFGFEKNCGAYKKYIEGVSFSIEDLSNNGTYYYTADEGVKKSKPIQYVHQLQNLYFALTGEELTIKE